MALAERGRGYLTSFADRKSILELITEAVVAGCRLFRACEAFKLAEEAKLTRATIVKILQSIRPTTFAWYRINPEGFISQVARIMREQKGLCDLLIVAIGNGALLRVDSKKMGLMFNFTNGQREVLKKLPASNYGGARFCLLLINDQFVTVTREEVDNFIEREKSSLCKI